MKQDVSAAGSASTSEKGGTYTGVAGKSLPRPNSGCILFDGLNNSFDASLVLYIYIYIYIYSSNYDYK